MCPKGSEVGSGFVNNAAGNSNDPTDKSIPCDLSLKIYNLGPQQPRRAVPQAATRRSA